MLWRLVHDVKSPLNMIERQSQRLISISGESFLKRSAEGEARMNQRRSSFCNSQRCCISGDHFLSAENKYFYRSLSEQSLIHVDNHDIEGSESRIATTQILRKCKYMILKPYKLLLLFIGWRSFAKERPTTYPLFWKFLNICYPAFVTLLIIYFDVFQAMTCHGKLNLETDTKPIVTIRPSLTIPYNNNSSETLPEQRSLNGFRIKNKTELNFTSSHQCDHVISTYVVPSVLHFLAFVYGFYFFRIQENEQLYALMERVFLQAQSATGSPKYIVRNSRVFLFGSGVWILLSIGEEVLYVMTFESDFSVLSRVLNIKSSCLHYFLVMIKFIGFMLQQCVNVAVFLNYSIQCEMLVMYINGLCLQLREKTIGIKEAMHEILGLRETISVLNGTQGKMMALCVVNFTALTIIGICLFICNKIEDSKVWAYRILFPCLWAIALCFPLIQASKVTKTGRKLRQISFEMRVFGYQTASQLELDSFILFIKNATLRAKLFGVIIRSATLVLTIGSAAFTLLLLMMADVVTISNNEHLF
ncbi:uncharacterized protein LOC143232463 isoform X2 [Tachypleus tridentatus]|uniref:uncharacterized protein LOC143232463 isoform X2 n=1 Tax=Tachypleus tridentatus TaxID=6853 RepID=UPI003FD054E0